MKSRLLFFFLLIVQIGFGQQEKPTRILGTKCSLIPPPGFTPASTFSGFQNTETGASIMINEIPARISLLLMALQQMP
jgi:hypothetical protein